MKILVTALYGKLKQGGQDCGGSGSFFGCLINELINVHDVTYTNNPIECAGQDFDLIISSHVDKLEVVKHFPFPKLHICQGIIPMAEQPVHGADHYVSISPEVQDHLKKLGFESTVVPQPIVIHDLNNIRPINDTLKNILIIRNNATIQESIFESFGFLTEKYDVGVSDISTPINDQIEWADLVITLGRGALESMAMGRNVLVADQRNYQGRLGECMLTKDTVNEIEYNNFSGRCRKVNFDQAWIENEISKYDAQHGKDLFEYVQKNNVTTVINKYFEIAKV